MTEKSVLTLKGRRRLDTLRFTLADAAHTLEFLYQYPCSSNESTLRARLEELRGAIDDALDGAPLQREIR